MGGTNRENYLWVGYRVCKLKSEPSLDQVWCKLVKLFKIFSFVWGNMPISSQAINRAAIFITGASQRLWLIEKTAAHIICNVQLTLISGPWYSMGSVISSQVLRTYYLTGLGHVFVPPLVYTCYLTHDFNLQRVWNEPLPSDLWGKSFWSPKTPWCRWPRTWTFSHYICNIAISIFLTWYFFDLVVSKNRIIPGWSVWYIDIDEVNDPADIS